MGTLRESFHLTEYPEEFIDKIVMYRLRKDQDLNRYLSLEEIAEKEHCKVEDVYKILAATAIIWTH